MDNKIHNIWEQRLAEYEASGKSIATWCKEQTVRENQFYYWRKKIRTSQAEKTNPVQWLTVDLQVNKHSKIAAETIHIEVGQATVKVAKGFNRDLLREIVQVLQTIQ